MRRARTKGTWESRVFPEKKDLLKAVSWLFREDPAEHSKKAPQRRN